MRADLDKLKGVIYGQAIGDALGLGTEFMTYEDIAKYYPHGLKHYDDIVRDRHRSRWKRGEWTDDTDMMLCIAAGYIEGSTSLSVIAQLFKAWSKDNPMGIGEHTYKVLLIGDYVEKPHEVSKVIWEISGRKSAGNGGLMRTSIVGLFTENVEVCAADICQLTHYDPRCVGSCVIVSKIIHSLVFEGRAPSYEQIVDWGNKYDERIKEYIDLAHKEDLKALNLQDDKSIGYTLKTLAAALWAYWNATSFEDGLISIVNAGGDADTNAAVACAILGAKFGFKNIPKEYVKGLLHKNKLDWAVERMTPLQQYYESNGETVFWLCFLLWPLNYMGKVIHQAHEEMDRMYEKNPSNPRNVYIDEDKRGISLGVTVLGCFLTILWVVFLLTLVIAGVIMLIKLVL